MKKYPILLYPITAISFFLIAWNIGNNAPVPSEHAFIYLVHSSGVWFLPVLIAATGLIVVCVLGTINSWFAVTTQRYIWVIGIALIFAVCGALAYTRYSAAHDPNISFRYNQFKIEKGWNN